MANSAAILERSLHRDEAIRAAGNNPSPQAELQVARYIVENALYESIAARRWLVARSTTQNYHIARKLVESLQPLVEQGYSNDAAAMFAALVGLEDSRAGRERRNMVFDMQSLLRHDIEKLLKVSTLISASPKVWGACVIRLQALLLADEEASETKHRNTELPTATSDQFYYGYFFQSRFYQGTASERQAWSLISKAVERGFTESVAISNETAFCELSNQVLEGGHAFAICQPLAALYDFYLTETKVTWQRGEAVRLLCLPEVEKPYAALMWRRLVRCKVIGSASTQERNALLETIRRFQNDERIRLNELADLAEFECLTPDETADVDRVRTEDALLALYDPRELRSVKVEPRPDRDTPLERFVKTWSDAGNHELLRLLADWEMVGGNISQTDFESLLFPRLEALNTIVGRAEANSPEWFGEVLGWCERAIEDLKRWCRLQFDVPKNTEITAEQYLQALNEKAGWWEDRAVAAIERLKLAPPASHADESRDRMSWNSNDPIACSVNYLDAVLAVRNSRKLETLRAEMAKSIIRSWPDWRSYTRGMVITCLRPYYWAECAGLTDMLIKTLQTETVSHDIEVSLQHLLQIGQIGITQLMRSIVSRIDSLTDPERVAHLIGGIIGNAVVRYRGSGEELEELRNIAEWYDDLRADHGQRSAAHFALVGSILEGAQAYLEPRDRLEDSHAEVWVSMINWGLEEWLELPDGQKDHLPVLPISTVFEIKWNQKQQAFNFTEITDVLIRIINEADLGGFYSIHYELSKLLKEEETDTCVTPKLSVVRSPETLIDFCRASAERVAQWRREKKTTNDIAYGHSISGGNTSDLIALTFEAAVDREDARRRLAPIIDILADAGLRDIAGHLRSKLRHS